MNEQLILNEKEIVNSGSSQYFQIVVFVGSLFFVLWSWVLDEKFRAIDPVSIRILLCAPAFLGALLSLKLKWFSDRLKFIAYGSISVAILHHHVVLYNSEFSMEYVLGGMIFLFTVVNVVLNPRSKVVFTVFFTVLSFFTCIVSLKYQIIESSGRYAIYLFGVLTVNAFMVINYLNYKKISEAFLSKINDNTNLKRWSSVGQMAGGIAHEVNTPLSTMMLILENLTEKLQAGKIDQSKKDVGSLVKIGTKIGSIVRSLRLLTMTGGNFERDKISLFDILIEVKKEYSEKFEENNIEFKYMYNTESDGHVWGSASSLKHVICNLVQNAIDAVSLIEDNSDKWIKLSLIEANSTYKILVQNGGPLIEKSIADRVFEPFFTTKEVGSAMGIGLSISKTLIHVHNGSIRLDAKNTNVTFEIVLPKIIAEKKKKFVA